MSILSLANQKGGVGKTTTTFNIGAAIAEQGRKVLLIDFDPQGNMSSYLGTVKDEKPTISELLHYVIDKGIPPYALGSEDTDSAAMQQEAQAYIQSAVRKNEHEKLDYIPSNILLSGLEQALMNVMCREQILKTVLSYLVQDYDYIFIDCPPSLGVLSVNALTASDEILVPVQAQNFALDGLILLLETHKKIRASANSKLKINGFILTMTNHTKMSRDVSQTLRDKFGALVYQTSISASTEAPHSTVEQRSLLASKTKLGQQYREIATEFLQREE